MSSGELVRLPRSVGPPAARTPAWDVTLDAGQRLGLDIALTIGSMQETVTVTAEAPPIQDRTSTIDTTIEPKSIEALPLSGRKTLNVVALSGAAVFIGYPSTPTGSPSFTLAGGEVKVVTLHLSTLGRTLLARTPLLKVHATIVAHDPAGAAHTTQTTITLRASKTSSQKGR